MPFNFTLQNEPHEMPEMSEKLKTIFDCTSFVLLIFFLIFKLLIFKFKCKYFSVK
jgi:hypothetical protein